MLMGFRLKGLGFSQQIELVRTVCREYSITLGFIEDNNFQTWLRQELLKYPETAHVVLGHRTGSEKADLDDGVPAMKVVMQNGLWEWPTGDEASAHLIKVLQAELSAFGWRDGKLQGVGEHDDTVMALWFTEKAARTVDQWLRQPPIDEIVTADELGIPRVQIGPDYDEPYALSRRDDRDGPVRIGPDY
jgi:hypothetical protein